MRVAVIGGGVAGTTTAYFLALNGHQVSVVEQHGNVCEEASLGHAGLLGSAHLAPTSLPPMSMQLLSHFFKPHSAINLRPRLNLTHWRWLRYWYSECANDRWLANRAVMLRLGKYSQELLAEISLSHKLDFQQRSGVLQLFRRINEKKKLTADLSLLRDAGIPFQNLDEAGCYQLEPTLNKKTPLAGGLYFPNDGFGNCALFTKQLKSVAQELGVQFEFLTECEYVETANNGVTLHLKKAPNSVSKQQFDATVVAAGAGSRRFLKSLGIALNLATFQSYSNTASVKNPDDSPKLSIIDESQQVAITQMDKRIRVAGTLHLGKNKDRMNDRAWQSLRKIGADWFPDAANFHTGQNWRGSHLMLPNGTPILGQSPVKNIFINMAHAEYGWSQAAGSGKILAELISGKSPEIDITGLTLSR